MESRTADPRVPAPNTMLELLELMSEQDRDERTAAALADRKGPSAETRSMMAKVLRTYNGRQTYIVDVAEYLNVTDGIARRILTMLIETGMAQQLPANTKRRKPYLIGPVR